MILHVEMSVADIAVGRMVLPVPLGQGQGVEWGENSGLRQTWCLNHVQWEKSLEESKRAAKLGGQFNGPGC